MEHIIVRHKGSGNAYQSHLGRSKGAKSEALNKKMSDHEALKRISREKFLRGDSSINSHEEVDKYKKKNK